MSLLVNYKHILYKNVPSTYYLQQIPMIRTMIAGKL